MEKMKDAPELRYKGFISYSRDNRKAAQRLHKALETYRLPLDVSNSDNSRGKLGRFFIDLDELPASGSIGTALRGALEDSEALIVIASPSAARSRWVNEEIKYFRTKKDRPILGFIVEGVPNSEDDELECFPTAFRLNNQPLAADLTQESFSRAFIRLVSGLLDVPFDKLWKREARRRRLRFAVGMAIVGISVLGTYGGLTSQQAKFDSQALTTRANIISKDGWQNAWRADFFQPALRAAIAATHLAGAPESQVNCDLTTLSDNPYCAVLLSGLSLQSRLIYGDEPITNQLNTRLDIEGSANHQRRMITVNPTVRDIAYSHSPLQVAMVTTTPEIIVVDLKGRDIIRTPLQSRSEVVSINADGTQAISADQYGNLIVVDVSTNTSKLINTAFGRIDKIVSIEDGWLVAIDGNLLIRLTSDFIPVWRKKTGETDVYNLAPYAHKKRKFVVLQSYGARPHVEIFDIQGRLDRVLEKKVIGEGVGQVKALAIDADATLLALGGNGSGGEDRGGGQVISLVNGEEVSRLIGHPAEIYAIEFSPMQKYIVTGSADFSIRVWEPESGQEKMRLIGHVAPIQDITVLPDNQGLISAAWDGTVRLWNFSENLVNTPISLVLELCRIESHFDRVSTILQPLERSSENANIGRPWDVCDWRGFDSIEGWRQQLIVILVRWFGLSDFDYLPPNRVR